MPPHRGRAVAAAMCGAIAAHLVPFASVLPNARAAWCWPAGEPECDAPVVTDGACVEGAVLKEGQVCTPTCSGGKVPSCSKDVTVQCPRQLYGDSCTNDIKDGGWWDPCGFGNKCLARIKMGVDQHHTSRTFECVASGSPVTSCSMATEAPPEIRSRTDMDIATIAFPASLVLFVLLGVMLLRLPSAESTRKIFTPGAAPLYFTMTDGLGLVLVLLGMVAFIVGLAIGRTTLDHVFITGLAAGIASALPIFWAFYRAGVHSLLQMSRESAWRLHILFGDLAIIVGIVHGAFVFAAEIDIQQKIFWMFGLFGLILMIVGVLSNVLVKVKAVTYDTWKILHFFSMLGYILTVIHMVDHAVTLKTARSWVVTILNLLALVLFIGQKVYVKVTAAKVTVKSAEVAEDAGGSHIFLTLSAPGFQPKPGQWGNLSVPKVSKVPHPFTLVPGAGEEVQFFIKVSGKFTKRLAEELNKGVSSAPKIQIEGPFGEPPLPHPTVDAVAFVLGGVGVTPSLSLVEQAKGKYGNKVCLYWAVRSRTLLDRCAPLLQPHINPELTCIRLSGQTGDSLPLGAQNGRQDVGEWMEKMATELWRQGAKSAMLFCCGPEQLSDAARKRAGRCSMPPWHIHVERFLFLPGSQGGGGTKKVGGTAQVIGQPAA